MFTMLKPTLLTVALASSVLLANWMTVSFGLVPAGFGLMVTAGTYAAGLALGLRDALHSVGGFRWVLLAIALGAGLSLLTGDGRIALASAVAFTVAELLDAAVYAPLRRRGWRRAVVSSNIVGAVADTLLFLTIAGFPLTYELIAGQLLVKAVWMTLLALAIGQLAVSVRRRQAATA
jgi:uncharacterized PurR-regulated membrane protein YhhQ (DUF165 family)